MRRWPALAHRNGTRRRLTRFGAPLIDDDLVDGIGLLIGRRGRGLGECLRVERLEGGAEAGDIAGEEGGGGVVAVRSRDRVIEQAGEASKVRTLSDVVEASDCRGDDGFGRGGV